MSEELNDPMLPPSQTQLHAMQRHRELLVDFQRDHARTKLNLRQALDRKQLLGNVKEDIKCVAVVRASAHPSAYRAQHASETEAFLNERAHLDRSHQMIDETLEYAHVRLRSDPQPGVRDAVAVSGTARPAARHHVAHVTGGRTDSWAKQRTDYDQPTPEARHGDSRGGYRHLSFRSAHVRHAPVRGSRCTAEMRAD